MQQSKRPKQKEIEIFIQNIQDFSEGKGKAKWLLEQHMTPPLIAAQIMNKILLQQQSLEGIHAADFGCGTGMLSAALIRSGADYVTGFEIDPKVAEQALNSIDDLGIQDQFEIIQTDLKQQRFTSNSKVDLVLMNPPVIIIQNNLGKKFGTKEQLDETQEGIDTIFLKQAFKICSGDIYSLHKTTTRDYLLKLGQKNERKGEVIMEIDFPLPKKFKNYHKKEIAYTKVDLIHYFPQ